jgi:hypothetical protein
MSLRADGSYCCDRCGVDVGNAGIDKASTVVDTEPDDPVAIRRFNFCRDRTEDGTRVRGCTGKVLTAKALANYLTTKAAT